LKPDRFTVLIVGGSRGAHSLNEKVVEGIIRLHQAGKPVQVIHLTGLADEFGIRRKYQQDGVAHAVFGFLHNMAEAYRRASLAICRSGSSTCAELCRFGIPALLVPYPFATSQHQLANARAMASTGAADVRVELELTAEKLADYIAAAMVEPGRLEGIRQAARARDKGDAAEALADLVEQVGSREEERENIRRDRG
jgi:UDP-N-acetylglucosamine--N-acetylmuramyl-(pentapeptide) pyrophosphoryl-undecaprenol N-acetylglucosamine transferase